MPSPSEPDEPRRQALEQFTARSRLAWRREQLDVAGVEVIHALNAAGIDALLLKGPALAARLYEPEQARGYFDIDLLVAPADRVAAGRVLRELGYADLSSERGVDDVAGVLHAELWSRVIDDFGNVTIDLHWRLDGCRAPDAVVWKLLEADRGRVEVAGRAVATLGDAATALHVALHLAQHGPRDAKAVGDLSRALEVWPRDVWDRAAQLALRADAQEALAAGLRLLPAGAQMADQLGLGAGEEVLWDLAHHDHRPRGTFHLDALARAATLRERLGVVRRALLPSPTWIRWEMRWASRGHLRLLMAYGLHVLRSPAWALQAARFRRRRADRV